MERAKTIGKRDVVLALVVIAGMAAGGIVLARRHMEAEYGGRGSLTGCKSNLKNIATSLEMYSTDNQGHYPKSLAQVTPNYLKVLPQCMAAQTDTYSASYHSAQKPDAYTFCCSGQYHTSSGIESANYPQYSSYTGLILP